MIIMSGYYDYYELALLLLWMNVMIIMSGYYNYYE